MDIATRKLNLIEDFLKISDENTIEKIESFIRSDKQNKYDRELKPILLNEFHEMIDEAKDDKANGRVISHEDLKKRTKSWKYFKHA